MEQANLVEQAETQLSVQYYMIRASLARLQSYSFVFGYDMAEL